MPLGCGAEGVRNSMETLRWLLKANTSYMAPWHRQRYLHSLRLQGRAQRKAALASGKKGDTAGTVTANTGVAATAGAGAGAGVVTVVKEAIDGLGEGSGGGGDEEKEKEKTTEQEEKAKISSATDHIDGLAEMENEDEKRQRKQEAVTEDEEEDDCGWREEEEEDETYDTVLPSIEELEYDVALPRLMGGYCSIGMAVDDESSDNAIPHKPVVIGKQRGGSLGSDPKKRKRLSQGNSKAKLPPKQTPAPKGKPGVSAQKAVSSVCAAPDAGRRAEAGDLSGLLVNGLFMTSVLILDRYMIAKEAAIEKVKIMELKVQDLYRLRQIA